MRRLFCLILALLLLAGFCTRASELSAPELARQLAQSVPEMQNVKPAPLKDTENRAIWTDRRTGQGCALALYESRTEAQCSAICQATRTSSIRIVDCAVLNLDSDLSERDMDEYSLALAEILNVEIEDELDYILNGSTKIFHFPGCAWVDEMRSSNVLEYSGARSLPLECGYSACEHCKP